MSSLTRTPRKRKAAAINRDASDDDDFVDETTPTQTATRRRTGRTTEPKSRSRPNAASPPQFELDTPSKTKRKLDLSTPTRKGALKDVTGTPARLKNADRSAKRKSVRLLLEPDEDDWDGGNRLAQEIWGEEEEGGKDKDGDYEKGVGDDGLIDDPEATPKTPKRGGRPKGAKNIRSPTPEGDIPPHERYFFQNRPGPAQTSNNTLGKFTLLTYEEFFDKMDGYEDPHQEEKDFLLELHQRSFPQWNFEFSEQFNICLYGFGSKRKLVDRFAEWLYTSRRSSPSPPTIIMVNGHAPNITLRSILATIITSLLGSSTPSKLGSQPIEVLQFLQLTLDASPPATPLTVLINSIDSPSLRRPQTQSLLARLAALPAINLLVTADTPNFPLMWDVSLRDQFNFVFHDCTTYAAFETELDVVDDVIKLLGRKGRRVNGKEGVGFVLRSLTANARNLYRILLTEVLSNIGDQGADDAARAGGTVKESVEYRNLYQKAVEEFICPSEPTFRILMKEFHDHEMITTRVDASGTEYLGIPLGREDMEAILGDLVAEA
ncbi:Origin recognition complex subunit 2 [Arachnomyces sp. PD_36]|nr:Origin recognition complex subunit 2 [Arachnomyces sp. PD_36]